MSYERGQIVPLDGGLGIVGNSLPDPRWHAIFVPPNKERTTSETLKAKGCYSFYPKRTARWFVRGKKIERDFPQITGMIYTKFKFTPQWHVMRERRLITGVMSIGVNPIQFPSEIIRRLQGLPGREDALRQARDELSALSAGDTAIMPEGILAGHFVQVSEIKADGTVFWFSDLMRGQSKRGELTKQGGASEAAIQAKADEIMGIDTIAS